MKPTTLLKALLFFPGGKEKVQCVNASPRLWELHVKQKHSAGSGTDNSLQPWASHLGIFVVLALF